jgi:hypothetical protein
MADDPKDKQSSQTEEFKRRIGLALASYQLIEEYLKIYIDAAHVVIQGLLRGRIPFRFPRTDYENEPLGRLITMFARYCDNDAFIKRLRSAQARRNYIAHKALVLYAQRRKEDPEAAKNILAELKKIEDEGWEVFRQMQTEFRKLRDSSEFKKLTGGG